MLEVLCHVNSLTISLDFLKGKFMLYRNTPDAEIKFVELNKGTGEEGLLFTLPMICGSALDHLAGLLKEMFMGRDHCLMTLKTRDGLHVLFNLILYCDWLSLFGKIMKSIPRIRYCQQFHIPMKLRCKPS
ncbi:hypothetical protein LWI28_017997 [Acer negundo]|uniref:Uncharacterized protein n=1 Tax=Acer negundo TaxID=4023 RepID=A0AAD5IFV0_ACENE|nr:hypothetical protein LWI28_017997 [Acer negundo]